MTGSDMNIPQVTITQDTSGKYWLLDEDEKLMVELELGKDTPYKDIRIRHYEHGVFSIVYDYHSTERVPTDWVEDVLTRAHPKGDGNQPWYQRFVKTKWRNR